MSRTNKLHFIEAMLNWFDSPTIVDRELDVKFLSDTYDEITAPAWVSVEEKMPEENTAPLVRMDLTDKFGEETILYDVVVFDGNGFHTPYKVTHWMQITPPVKKKEANNGND